MLRPAVRCPSSVVPSVSDRAQAHKLVILLVPRGSLNERRRHESLSTSPFLLDNAVGGEQSIKPMGRWADKKSLQMNEHLFAQILFAVPSIHPSIPLSLVWPRAMITD